MATTPVRVRNRSVNLQVQSNADAVNEQLRGIYQRIKEANKRKNAATSEEKKLIAEAEKLMDQHMLRTGPDFSWDGSTWEAAIESTEGNEVDIELFAGKVSYKDFVSVAKVTQGAIKEKFGTNILNTVLKSVKSAPALKLKKK